MSSGSSPGNRRCRKKDKDHISNLPDTILCYILSFLNTNSAVKTSILSKKWKYVWTKVPALDFTGVINDLNDNVMSYDWLFSEQKIRFKNFVDKVLFHNDASYVQRFCLKLSDVEAYYCKICNLWLIAASRREMHELDIVLDQCLDVSLPPRFLSSGKLVILKLKGSISINASVPFHLPNLKTIHLSHLEFPNDEFMRKLSSSCPVLRELHIVSCRVKATTLCVESMTLKSLLMSSTSSIQGMEPVHVVIKTPNLTYLHLQEYHVSPDIGDMSSLIEADFSLGGVAVKHMEKLLTKVSGVKTLHLRSKEFSKLNKLPVFPNLTWLKCGAGNFLSNSLHCAPKLKSLSLIYFVSSMDSLFDPKFAPEHLQCLESIVIDRFSGEVKELEMVAYFLKAASALREMKINFSYDVFLKINLAVSVCQELLDMPRSSAVCRVKIMNPCL